MTSAGTKSGRGTGTARASRAARDARPDRVAVRRAYRLGIGTGMALSLLISAVAFFTTRPDPNAARLAAAGAGVGKQNSHAGHDQGAGQQGGAPSGATAAAIDVNATHRGNLQVVIEATISAPKTYDPITMGEVYATFDMIEMPMSHTSAPAVMAELPGKPGTYQTVTTVPMIGRYDITVTLKSPMAAEAHKRIDISSVAATQP